MNRYSGLMFRFYHAALLIYPRYLRLRYRSQIMQTVSDARQESSAGPWRFWFWAFRDLLQSSLKERMNMITNQPVPRSLFLHTLSLAVALTMIGIAAAIAMQQMLRRGADEPQIDMVNWYAAEISAGEAPADVIPPGYVDLERSLQPFVIFYDDQGRPGPGTGYLDQAAPTPPKSVLEYVRIHGGDKVTWQPREGIRLAAVIKRVEGKSPGFILAARSLRLVQEQDATLRKMVLGIWLVVMFLIAAGAAFLNRTVRPYPKVPA